VPAPFAVFALQLNSRQHQQLLRHSHYRHTMLISYSHHASDETSCNACLRMLEWGLEEEKTFGVHCKRVQRVGLKLWKRTRKQQLRVDLAIAC